MKNALKTLNFEGKGIQFTADGWINATATVQALEKEGLDNFLRSETYLKYAAVVAKANSVNITELKVTRRGRYDSGTFLHPKLAIVFARWISPEFAYWCDEQVPALIQKAKEAPIKAVEARTRRLQRLGRPTEVIALRLNGVEVRKAFTDRLKLHGVNGIGFADCSRAHYFPLFGGSTDVIRQKLDVPGKDNVRDYMSLTQLSAISLSEALSAERIEKERVYGNNACVEVCNKVGRDVANLVVDTRRGLAQ